MTTQGDQKCAAGAGAADQTFFPDFSRKLVRVQYPGVVENVDNMMDTLGGKDNLEIAVGSANRRLNLRFRPKDKFCKPCAGDKNYNPGILLKVRYRIPKIDPDKPGRSTDEEPKPVVIGYEVAGISVMNFVFKRMCDFQYLPIVPEQDSEEKSKKLRCIYRDVLPDELPNNEWLCHESSKHMPYFFLPSLFSRYDMPQDLIDIDKFLSIDPELRPDMTKRIILKQQMKNEKMQGKGNIIMKSRGVRKGHTIFVNFDSPTIPSEPREAAVLEYRNRYPDGIEAFDKLKELFEERPVWSKAALQFLTGINHEQMKNLLPLVAYYFQTGPWRVMWVKYGYDPRKKPETRILQTFDFRIRTIGGLKLKVQAKRNYSSKLAHYRPGTNVKKFSLQDLDKKTSPSVTDESCYIFRPGMIPPARQMFYQYKDIYIPEIQAMISRLPDVQPKFKCDLKNGWLPNGFNDQCREIASKYIQEQVQMEILLEKQKKMELEETSSQSTEGVEINFLDEQDSCIVIDSEGGASDSEGSSEKSDEEARASSDEGSEIYEDDIDLEIVDEINKLIEQSKSKSKDS